MSDPSNHNVVPLADPNIGRVLGDKYEIQRQIGKGGAGRVYVGIQHPLGRRVAIKVLRTDIDEFSHSQFSRRFSREAALASRLRHDHVVTVHDCGTTSDGLQYVVMELLEGRTLKAMLRDGPLAAPDLVRISLGLARGLRHAHAEGLVHRDIKPSNVFLVQDDEGVEQPKLLDFGLVKDTKDVGMTQTSSYMGTPAYMAPEQTKGADVDHRADLYSLGCVLFELAAGQRPFVRPTAIATAVAHLHDPPPRLTDVAPERKFPVGYEPLIRQLLEKEPEDRPADADAVVAALKAMLRMPVATPVMAPVRSESPVGWWVAGGTLVAAAAVLGLALIASVGVALWWLNTDAAVAPPTPLTVPALDSTPDVIPTAQAPAVPEPTTVDPLVAPLPSVAAEPEPVVAPVPIIAPVPIAEAEPVIAPQPVVVSEPVPVAEPAVLPAPTITEPVAAAVWVDGVHFDGAHAVRALDFVNTAEEAELRRAGVYGRGVGILMERRPFGSLSEVGDTAYIGESSLRAVHRATAVE